MILRRITKHVTDQNWFAVFIDFLIVVVGILIAFQITNWNEQLNDQQRAKNYYDRLSQEMTINRETLVNRQVSYTQQLKYGQFALNASEPPKNDETAWSIIHAFYQASHVFTITQQRGTYDEIISSGDLALLKNQKLINALSEFYTFAGFSSIHIIPPYRENLRRIIPLDLQRYFQGKCYQVVVPDTHFLLDCPPPEGASNLTSLAIELLADKDLKKDLRYMMSYADVSTNMSNNITKSIDFILDKLSTSSH